MKSPAPCPLAAVRDVVCRRNGATLLAGVSLDIQRGEYVALVGANGSGKTTLLRHLNGLIQPTEGSVEIDGIPTSDEARLPEIRKLVGMVFQDPDDQMVAVTVEDEIAFGLENLGMPRDTMVNRVAEVLRRFHLEHVRDRATTSLSGGEQQRVAIAAVWATEPALLVLDEPTSMLDRPSATELLRFLDDLHRRHSDRAILHVTQNLTETLQADRVVVLDAGRVVYDGSPSAFLADTRRLDALGLRGSSLPCAGSTGGGRTRRETVIAENVHYTRRDGPEERDVLHGMSVAVRTGEILAVIGRSGSGKTTFAWHLNRLLEPARGRVLLDGQDISLSPIVDVRRQVGLTFQRVDLQLFEPTVEEDVAFGLVQRGVPREVALERSRAALRELGLDPDRYATRRPVTLSVGEQRRVALAGVIVLDPRVVVFDEPTSGLDGRGVISLTNQVMGLVKSDRAVVIVTHDLDFARSVAHRVLVVEDGRGLVHEDVAETLDRLETEWTRPAPEK